MSKLQLLANKSNLMRVEISYGDDEVVFNLYQEAKINENIIDKEIKEQPNSYGFLGMLSIKLKRRLKDAEAELERVYARKYVINKENEMESTGKPPSDDLAKQLVFDDPEYHRAKAKLIKAEEEAGVIEVCVQTFIQRASLIQTLAANIRKSN